jgi:HNH endonuclease
MIPAPVKPFPNYKWRWLSVAPTESLFDPPVFLGVLRVFARNEGKRTSDPTIAADLALVDRETGTPVDLVRTPERNLIRNSGQYWKGTGLLEPRRGIIELTPFGKRVAEGSITQSEFAAIMVQQTVLPNPLTYKPEEVAEWQQAGLEIRPLELILEVLDSLGRNTGNNANAYITPSELLKICIPLAGVNSSSNLIAQAILEVRAGNLDVSGWPDCAPGANDHRMSKEFLLFLTHFGLCRLTEDAEGNERFCLDELYDQPVALATPRLSLSAGPGSINAIVDEVRHSALPSIIERQRTLTSVLARTGQSQFRSSVLRAFQGRCIVTGDTIERVLEAAHIIPVTNQGSDGQENSLCLRIDVHRLFDAGDVRIQQNGDLRLSDRVRASRNYTFLPDRISLPQFVNPVNLQWRETYLWF